MMPGRETPASLGYRWPAEWAPHAATWLAWPHNRETWPGDFEPIPEVFERLARELARHERVRIVTGPAHAAADVRRRLAGAANVELVDLPTNDAWIRDFGPIFLSPPPGAPPALVAWRYNAWGGKYPPYDEDARAAARIAQLLGRRCFRPPLVLEGGAIDGDGAGTVLTTESCLLDPRRNPGKGRADVEALLRAHLGARRILWLPGGAIAGDDTDGHVDQLARFVAPGRVVAAREADPGDENYAVLEANFQALRAAADADGRRLEVLPLPMPRPVRSAGQRLPASYCNFYVANGVVVVPQFDDAADQEALRVLGRCFPERRLCRLPARDLVRGLGGPHCVTQQEPA